MRNKIGVFIILRFVMNSASGGAENICRMVTIGLAKTFDIVVFHSEPNRNAKLGKIQQQSKHIQSVNAFYLDDWSRERGEISPKFCDCAKKMMAECEILLSFERVLTNVMIDQLCILGGISYQHCEDIAKSNIWKQLIVPSEFIREKCMVLSNRKGNIKVISNGIVCDNFFSSSLVRKYAALLPYRPDSGKGFYDSIDFIAMVNKLEEWGEYHIIVTRQDENDFTYEDFYEKLDNYALQKSVRLEYVTWQAEGGMNNIYNKCDFVLALGYLEEGFGLTTIESILAGRYVISKRKGATIQILPNKSGILFADEHIKLNSVITIMSEYEKAYLLNEVDRGIAYIKEHYDVGIMQKKYEEFVINALKK